jgi:hypothetical protein
MEVVNVVKERVKGRTTFSVFSCIRDLPPLPLENRYDK